MGNIVVAGIGTGVGKTVVSAILTVLFNGDYWKPVQCGNENTDGEIVAKLVAPTHTIFPSAYTFKAPVSPHHAAFLENITFDGNMLTLPQTERTLVIEMAGGILVPLNEELLNLDLFRKWNAKWVVVSRHYLGSINHTLLTLEMLKRSSVDLLGIVFNGEATPSSEKIIEKVTNVPVLGHLLPEKIRPQTIQRYAKQWQQSGTLLLK